MYTVEIGRQFLKYYNQKTSNDYSALEFFEEELFPVVFDSKDYLHLMHVHGSAFFQPSYKRLAKKENVSVPDFRKNKFYTSIENIIRGNNEPHGGVGVGFMAGGVDETTSGQVSNIVSNLSKKGLLYSWIGGALGVGFGGGYDFLFENDEINWFLFKGWEYYRMYLNQTSNAKGRQIETWNGLWINYGLSNANNLDRAFRETIQQLGNHTKKAGNKLKLDRPDWIKQLFSLARYFGGENDKELIYGYGFGQMNTTLGFLQLDLGQVKYMADLFDQLIADDPKLRYTERIKIEDAYKTFFSLEQACAMGGIGVQAIRPKDLKKYTTWTNNKNVKSFKFNKEEERIKFFTYITWIQAMLKNEDTLNLAEDVAESLIKYEGEEERLRTRIKAVEELWDSYNRQQLIDKFAAIVDEEPRVAETINKAVDQLMTHIPQDMYRLFLTLVKFKYNYYQTN